VVRSTLGGEEVLLGGEEVLLDGGESTTRW